MQISSSKNFVKSRAGQCAAVLILGLIARLFGIASRPLWYDEAFSILFSEKGISAMLYGTLAATGAGTADVHPLGYYGLLWAWMRVFGESPVSVRMLSILAGLGVIAIVYLLTNELFNSGVAFAAGIIVALDPFQVHYAQEIRMYSFMALWLSLATYAYWRASQSSGWKWWLAFSIFAALAQYTQNLAAFYLVPLALWPLFTKNRKALKAVILAGLFAMLLYLPWLIHLPAQFAKVSQAYWTAPPDGYRLFTLLLVFITNLPLPNSWLFAGLFIALFVISVCGWQTFRAARQQNPSLTNGLWILYLSFAPPILLFLFSQWKSVYIERALLPSGVMFCVWLAWAWSDTKLPKIIQGILAALLIIGFGMGLYQHVTYTSFPYAPYKTLTQYLDTAKQTNDVVVHSNKLSMLPSVYYDRQLAQTFVGDPPGSSVDTLAPATQQVLGLKAEADIQAATGDARRVWFILFKESNQEYIDAGKSMHPQLAWLMQNYSLLNEKDWGDLQVYLFSK